MVDARRVQVDVGPQLLLLVDGVLHRLEDLSPHDVAVGLPDVAGELLQHRGARVHRSIHGVAEPHHLLVALEAASHVRLGLLG